LPAAVCARAFVNRKKTLICYDFLETTMLPRLILAAILLLAPTAPVFAQEREPLGWGRFFNNDYIGDKKDRWHTSSYTISHVRGPAWTGALPTQFGDLQEFRFRADTIAPAQLVAPAANDRRFAGVLSFGLHSHFQRNAEDISLGADLVMIGPQTGLSNFQDFVHDGLGLPQATVYGDQLPNMTRLAVTGEVGRTIVLGENMALRPFVEGQVGVETMLRGGADLVLGTLGRGGVMLRDQTTGQRYSAVQAVQRSGFSITIGADIARVFNSAYLPAGGAATLSPLRARARAGLNWQGNSSFVFFGVTHLGPEFDQQPTGQMVGSLSLLVKF
jgi:hypothetical protein